MCSDVCSWIYRIQEFDESYKSYGEAFQGTWKRSILGRSWELAAGIRAYYGVDLTGLPFMNIAENKATYDYGQSRVCLLEDILDAALNKYDEHQIASLCGIGMISVYSEEFVSTLQECGIKIRDPERLDRLAKLAKRINDERKELVSKTPETISPP